MRWEVVSRRFGSPVRPDRVIGESLERSTPSLEDTAGVRRAPSRVGRQPARLRGQGV